jgi:hypothetical protein
VEIIIATIITAGSGIVITLLERERRSSKVRWEESEGAHNVILEKIDTLGNSLGRSIDRVEATSLRTEEKLDQHINDHVTGRLAS